MRLITHSGSFHADDLFSYALLSEIFPEHVLIRTRDDKVFQAATSNDVIFDVGMEFNPARNRFDHHMLDKPMRDIDHPYSSFGLIWKYYGKQYLASKHNLSDSVLDYVHEKVDQDFVLYIDCGDNGVPPRNGKNISGPLSLSFLVEDANPQVDPGSLVSAEEQDAAFVRTAELTSFVLKNQILKACNTYKVQSILEQAIKDSDDPRVIVLPAKINWQEVFYDLDNEEALFVVYPDNGAWYCNTVSTEYRGFVSRHPLPAEWGGLKNEELASVSGVDDAVFAHTARFICAANSKDGILKMTEIALEHQYQSKVKF